MTQEPAQQRDPSQATLALALGILSLACLPIFGPAAWAVARDELRGIDAGRRDPSRRGQARVARVLGIIGTLILVLAVVAVLVAIVVEGPEVLQGIMQRPPAEEREAAALLLPW